MNETGRPMPRKRRKRRGNYERCGIECPVGTIRTRRRNRRGLETRFIKVRMRGPRKWITLARYTWEQMHGPVPRGMRVVHLDGNTLHDAPDNYGLLTPGQVAQLCHQLDPEMSRENHQGRKRREATVQSNRLRSQVRRAVQFLATYWYAVDRQRRFIYDAPFRSRTQLAVALGLLEAPRINGAIAQRTLDSWPVELVRGAELAGVEYRVLPRRALPPPAIDAERSRA